MKSGEIRQNKATRQWVIYAPARARRPKDFRQLRSAREHLPTLDKACPFCPGKEYILPSIIMEMPGKDSGPWQTRVVPNKFPVLTPEGDINRFKSGIYLAMGGYGHHEVIIESPLHNRQIGLMSEDEVVTVIETYHRRYLDLMEDHENMMVIIFRNYGLRAGTSMVHPHSQLIVIGMVPHHIRWRDEEARRYYDEWGKCVYCDILEYELTHKERIVAENGSFVAFVPFAAEVPFETWVVPREHKADFGDISDEEKTDLARVLKEVLTRLYKKLNDPDYNYVINTSARFRSKDPQLHWYLQIRPRLTTRAGFEIGSGISINPSMPEGDAKFLREDKG